MKLVNPPNVQTSKDWRSVAREDQEKKLEKQSATSSSTSDPDQPSTIQILADRELAIKEYGWRGAQSSFSNQEQIHQANQDHKSNSTQNSEPVDSWRAYKLSEENKALREQDRKEKMALKSAKRARKAEQAIASWEKQKQTRSKSKRTHPSHSDRYTILQPNSFRTQEKTKTSRPTDRSLNVAYEVDISPSTEEQGIKSSQKKREYRKTRDKKTKRKPPISETWIKNAGLKYLGRFSASEQHFRYTMLQKIRNAESRESDDAAVHQNWIDAAVKLAKEYGFLDDQKYADALANSLKRRGLAKSAARQKLRQKRLGQVQIDKALEQSYMQSDEAGIDPNLFAAARAAKKKRLGPWGPENIDYPTLQKQLAKLARRGFSYGIAKQVLQASLKEAEQWLLDGDL